MPDKIPLSQTGSVTTLTARDRIPVLRSALDEPNPDKRNPTIVLENLKAALGGTTLAPYIQDALNNAHAPDSGNAFATLQDIGDAVYDPTAITGDITINSTNVATIGAKKVTAAMLADDVAVGGATIWAAGIPIGQGNFYVSNGLTFRATGALSGAQNQTAPELVGDVFALMGAVLPWAANTYVAPNSFLTNAGVLYWVKNQRTAAQNTVAPASDTANFQAIGSGGGAVSSVYGRTGAVIAQSGDYTAAQVGAIPTTAKAAANGVASLGADGKVPSAQLPTASSATTDTPAYNAATTYTKPNQVTYNTPTGLRFFQSTNTGAAAIQPTPTDGSNVINAAWEEISGNGASVGGTAKLYSATGQNTDGAMTQKAISDIAQDKLPTPTYSATMVVNMGQASSATTGVVQATGDITSLTAVLRDGCWCLIPIKNASAGTISVTVPDTTIPFTKGTLRSMQLTAGEERQVILHRNGTVYKSSFI